MMIKTAKCCSPLPGDAIKGYVSTGRGIIVHKADCPNITKLAENKDRIVDVEWDSSNKLSMPVKYKAILEDTPGVFVEISTIIKDMGLNIYEMNIKNYIDFLKTTIEESEQDDEMLPEAKELLEELEKRLPYYEFNNGDVVYIGIDEYEIKLIKKFDELKIPYIIVVNKIDEKPLSDAILADLQKYTKNILKYQ